MLLLLLGLPAIARCIVLFKRFALNNVLFVNQCWGGKVYVWKAFCTHSVITGAAVQGALLRGNWFALVGMLGYGLVARKRAFVCSAVFLNRENGLVIKFNMFGRLRYFRNGFKFAFDGFAVATFCFRGAVWFPHAGCGISGADLLLTSRSLQWLQCAVALGCQ